MLKTAALRAATVTLTVAGIRPVPTCADTSGVQPPSLPTKRDTTLATGQTLLGNPARKHALHAIRPQLHPKKISP